MKVRIIAEIAQAHDGSLGQAHAFIDALGKCGVDYIKFQTHIAEYESSFDEPWRIQFSYEDKLRFDYWKRMEFTYFEWKELYAHVKSVGAEFLGTPFSLEAFEMLKGIGVSDWKIASGEVANPLITDAVAATHRPVFLSTGMSNYSELDRVVGKFDKDLLTLMQCTTKYPTPLTEVGLNILLEMRDRYGCKVGLSDHSGTVFPGMAAVSLGASSVEVHACMSKYDFGPDTDSALEIDSIKWLVEGIRSIEEMLNNPVDKEIMYDRQKEHRYIFTKSFFAQKDIEKGETITIDNIGVRKPMIGIPASDAEEVLGKRAGRAIKKSEWIKAEDIDGYRKG